MAHSQELITTLKRLLKARGLTYAALAPRLGLSEASVKRLFSRHSFTLDRLDSLCRLLGLELSELARLAEDSQPRPDRLSEAQENALVSDLRLLLVAILALNQWHFSEILQRYQFSAAELVHYLLQLERLGLLDLLPENRIRLRISQQLQWLEEGPVRRFFRQQAQQEFLDAPFSGPGEFFHFAHGMFTPTALAQLQQRLQRTLQEFAEQHQDSRHASLDDRYGCSLLIALRPWELKAFESLRHAPDTRTLPLCEASQAQREPHPSSPPGKKPRMTT